MIVLSAFYLNELNRNIIIKNTNMIEIVVYTHFLKIMYVSFGSLIQINCL